MRKIAHISDLHFGRHDPRIADRLLQSLSSHDPDLIVISGDLTQRAKRDEFIEAERFLRRINRPLLIVPGNHDMPLYNLFRRFRAPFRRYDRHIAPLALPHCFYVDDELAVLGLNTARRLKWKEGRISLAQMAHIQKAFGSLPVNVWKIVATHHPVASAASSLVPVVEHAQMALRAVAAAKVHILLSGHHHHALSGEGEIDLALQHSILVIHAGTAVSTRTREGLANSYNLLQLRPAHLSVAVMAWRGESGFREAACASYVLEKNRWRSADGDPKRAS